MVEKPNFYVKFKFFVWIFQIFTWSSCSNLNQVTRFVPIGFILVAAAYILACLGDYAFYPCLSPILGTASPLMYTLHVLFPPSNSALSNLFWEVFGKVDLAWFSTPFTLACSPLPSLCWFSLSIFRQIVILQSPVGSSPQSTMHSDGPMYVIRDNLTVSDMVAPAGKLVDWLCIFIHSFNL